MLICATLLIEREAVFVYRLENRTKSEKKTHTMNKKYRFPFPVYKQ